MRGSTFFLVLLLLCGFSSTAQISGAAFRDFNANGTQETTNPIEPGIGGVTVNLYDSVNTLIATTTTSTATATLGQYSFNVATVPLGKSVRIEFSGLISGDKQGFGTATASGNGSAIQFAKAPSTTSNYGVSYPRLYSSTTDPFLATNRYTAGDATAGGTSGTALNLMVMNQSATGDQTAIGTSTQNRYTGAVFGLAYQKETRKLFQSAYLKRFNSFGPSGIGAIYYSTVSATGVPSNPALFVDVSTIGITVGADPHSTLPGTPTGLSNDAPSWPLVGKRGLGGMTVSDDGKYLYVVNMNPTGSPLLPTLNRIFIDNPAVVPTSANVTSWPIPTPTLTGGTTAFRPMAVKYWKGRIFVGGVCVKEITANQAVADTAGMKGVVYEFNETAGTFTTVLSWPLTYKRPYIDNNNNQTFRTHYWGPWQNSTTASVILYDAISGTSTNGSPYGSEPMLADLDFDVNGDMIIGLRDRWGDQMGWGNYLPVGTSTTYNGISSSEILRAGNCSGSTFTLENNASVCSGTATGGANLPGYASYSPNTNNVGPGGGLYYFNENPPTFNHQYRSNGGLAVLAGSNLLTFTAMDPTNTFNTGGILHTYNTTTGGNNAGTMRGGTGGGTMLFTTGTGGPGKAAGMGDVEYLTDAQPIQIGNRIWDDANGNGIQDAGETTLAVAAGTTVTLRSPGPDGDYTTTADNQSWTTTTNADGTYYFSALSSADTRKPAGWTGVGNVVLPNKAYRIEINVPSGFLLTKTDAAANAYDNIDNDAVLNTAGTVAYIDINTADVNHSYDFGFKPLATLGDRVWLDNGLGGGTAGNGIQDGTEPGVAGVTVTLFNSSGVPVGTTVTDAYGIYLFDNLTPGNYTVGFTLPANYTFTTQTNTTDDNNTTGISTTGSDVNVTTGITYTITLSAGENNRNIDAGLIFNTPAVTQSLGNTVWLDTDKNGVQNGTEPGIAGVTVTLYSGTTIVAATVTDAAGHYLFNNIATGTYTVGFTLPVGMQFTTQGTLTTDLNSDANVTTGRTGTITVNSGDNIVYVDAGVYPIPTTTASLGDRVWNDLNHNGVQDANEPGVAGITVNLIAANGVTVVATTTTDAYGYYMFTNLTPAGYYVEFVKPATYTYSPKQAAAGTFATDSDPSTTTGRTAGITLLAGDRNTSVDAGIYLTAPAGTLKLGDRVWNDLNRDGIQTTGEPGVAGVTVTLYRNGPDGLAGTTDDILVATTFTDANGNYIFTDLAASVATATYYNISFSNLPANYSFTILNQATGGGNTTNDNNANGLGRTAAINLTADDLTIDAGIVQGTAAGKGSLGDYVWYDLNSNGVQDAGELGVAGVTVTLQKDAAGTGAFTTFTTTTTNALGGYMFGGLDAGAYKVVFSNLPVGAVIAPKDAAAATDDTDSDGDNAGVTIVAATTSTTGVYYLATGEDNLSVDLGIIPATGTNTLGDFVWYDLNSNGIQDSGEPGVEGVAVTLYNSTGTAVGRTATDKNGLYLFTGLANGTYSVGFSSFPAGFDVTTKSATNDLTGSDADLINAKTPTVTLTYSLGGANRDNRSLDAGIVSTRAGLGNYVWLDTNGDGVQDASEKGVSGVTVILYASDGTTVLASTVTDAYGKYYFPNLTAGSYVVGFTTIPGNLTFTTQVNPGDNQVDTNSDANPATGKTSVIVLSAGEVDLTIDAGLKPTATATVGDYVWSDLNSDGVQDAGEPGIGGIIATLYDASNNVLGSAVTDGNGKYLITNVPPGTGYYIIFTNSPNNPSGLQPSFTTKAASYATTNTSHANSAGKTDVFNVLAGDNITYVDAGIKDYPGRAVLPVQSLELSATLHETTATINWVTDNEINTSKFVVERSTDNTNFTAVGERAGAGTYAGTTNYVLTDDVSALTNAPVIYYRIKAVDIDGRFTYSKVVAVRLTNISGIRVWPSPFVDKLNISVYSSTAQKVQVLLTDITGRVIMTNSYSISRGNNQLNINNLGNLSAASYMLKIAAADGTFSSTQLLLKK